MHGSWQKSDIHPVNPEWLEAYDRAGIDFRSLECERVTWWDKEVLQMLRDHGTERFRKIGIWDKDWNAVASQVGLTDFDVSDPRSPGEKMAHCLLKTTQNHRGNLAVRAFERCLRMSGW
jgi:hypothetical protein